MPSGEYLKVIDLNNLRENVRVCVSFGHVPAPGLCCNEPGSCTTGSTANGPTQSAPIVAPAVGTLSMAEATLQISLGACRLTCNAIMRTTCCCHTP